MPIRGFDAFCQERKLIQASNLSMLKGCSLGIDATYYLQQILTSQQSKEPLTSALGGLPLALRNHINRDLDDFERLNIKPVFVFNGINLLKKEDPFSRDDKRPSQRTAAWQRYEKGEVDAALQNFGQTLPNMNDIAKFAQSVLAERDVDFQVAPYSAWAQFSYLQNHPSQYIDCIYGASEVLLYQGVERLVTSLRLGEGKFSWVLRRDIINAMGISDEQFLDVCLLSGCEFCPTFAPLEVASPYGPNFNFKAAIDMIKAYRTGYNAILNLNTLPPKPNSYNDKYQSAWCAIKYPFVLGAEGKLQNLNSADIPLDIHEIIGTRLPEEIYYYLSRGYIGTNVINTLVSGIHIENAPLDNGDSQEYRKFLGDLHEIRTQALSLLTHPLHRYFQNKKTSIVYWYAPGQETQMQHKVSPTPYEETAAWNVRDDVLDAELKAQNNSKVDLRFAVQTLAKGDSAKKTKVLKDAANPLQSTNEVVANTLWRTMQLRQLVSNSHELTKWGRALAIAVEATSVDDDLSEALYLAFELLKLNVLKREPFTSATGGGPSKGSDDEKNHIRLISRVASLLQLRHREVPWSGPVSQSLMAFNSFVKTFSRCGRNLMEMVALSLALNGNWKRDDAMKFGEVSARLPLGKEVNAGLGVVVQAYLDETTSAEVSGAKETLTKLFPGAVDVFGDVQRAFKLWDAVVAGVKAAHKDGIVGGYLLGNFEAADEWLKSRRI
ncbi:hypothetical protein YB2330_000475 [Saitoella coloradoensis]